MKLNETTLKELEDSALKQIYYLKSAIKSENSFIAEFDGSRIHIGTTSDYEKNVYSYYGEVEDTYFNGKSGCQYFNLYGHSIEELNKDVKQLIRCLPTVLPMRERCERISNKIASYIENKIRNYTLYVFITDQKATWGITPDEFENEEDLRLLMNEKLGDVRGNGSSEKIDYFYEELTEEEETWSAYESEPSEKIIYEFVMELLERNLKLNILVDNLMGEDMSKYEYLRGIDKFLRFDDELY